jgi:hypothetical protein
MSFIYIAPLPMHMNAVLGLGFVRTYHGHHGALIRVGSHGCEVLVVTSCIDVLMNLLSCIGSMKMARAFRGW